jgi:hypothetical protein
MASHDSGIVIAAGEGPYFGTGHYERMRILISVLKGKGITADLLPLVRDDKYFINKINEYGSVHKLLILDARDADPSQFKSFGFIIALDNRHTLRLHPPENILFYDTIPHYNHSGNDDSSFSDIMDRFLIFPDYMNSEVLHKKSGVYKNAGNKSVGKNPTGKYAAGNKLAGKDQTRENLAGNNSAKSKSAENNADLLSILIYSGSIRFSDVIDPQIINFFNKINISKNTDMDHRDDNNIFDDKKYYKIKITRIGSGCSDANGDSENNIQSDFRCIERTDQTEFKKLIEECDVFITYFGVSAFHSWFICKETVLFKGVSEVHDRLTEYTAGTVGSEVIDLIDLNDSVSIEKYLVNRCSVKYTEKTDKKCNEKLKATGRGYDLLIDISLVALQKLKKKNSS